MTSFTLREWETLRRGEEEGCIPPGIATRLLALARASSFAGPGGGGVLEERGDKLCACGVVGVLAAENCSLEILPKIDVATEEGVERQNAAIRRRLVHMLAVAFNLKIEAGLVTELDWQRVTLLEILIRVFCAKLTEAVRRGMPRRYRVHEDDLPALRGTLDVPRQFTRHAVNPARLSCRFDELSEDIALNRIMKTAVSHLSRISRNGSNQQRLRELVFLYADVSDVPPTALRWEDVIIDRTNSAWQELLAMARLFLRNQYQNTSSGSARGTALLFEMNTLFEEYVGRLIMRALSRTEFQVSLQGGRKYCLMSLDGGRELFQTKPDILIRRQNKIVQVIDTKWKRISSRIDDEKQGVSQSDVYQMMAYGHLYEAPRLTLLYPHHEGLAGDEGVQARFRISGHDTVLETASVDVADGQDIIGRLRDKILPAFPENFLATA